MRGVVLGLLFAGLVAAGLCLVIRLYMDRAAEDALRPDERIRIADLRSPLPGNAALACPPDYCAVVEAIPSPIFAVSALHLAQALSDAIAREPRVVWVDEDAQRHPTVVIQHSFLLRFPDVITIEYVALGPDRSSLAIYSRARYGRGDFGVNRRRLLRWLARLKEVVSRETTTQ